MDNMFSNVIDPDIISGNLSSSIPDLLYQFAIILNMFGNISGNNSNIYERNWSIFYSWLFFVDWENLLKTDELNADNSAEMYLDKISMLLDNYAPLKKFNKYMLKLKSKP